MTARQETKTITKKPDFEVAAQDKPSQLKRPEVGQFRLQVDRQTKSSYPTLEAAEVAGLVIKQEFPLVHVTVYDSAAGSNTTIEAPKS